MARANTEARREFAAAVENWRQLEHDHQVTLHEMRERLGRPLGPNDIPMSMIEDLEGPLAAARESGARAGRSRERVDGVLQRVSRREKRRVDRQTGINTLR